MYGFKLAHANTDGVRGKHIKRYAQINIFLLTFATAYYSILVTKNLEQPCYVILKLLVLGSSQSI